MHNPTHAKPQDSAKVWLNSWVEWNWYNGYASWLSLVSYWCSYLYYVFI